MSDGTNPAPLTLTLEEAVEASRQALERMLHGCLGDIARPGRVCVDPATYAASLAPLIAAARAEGKAEALPPGHVAVPVEVLRTLHRESDAGYRQPYHTCGYVFGPDTATCAVCTAWNALMELAEDTFGEPRTGEEEGGDDGEA